ncbi:MAG: glycosyltransferase 87 family protein, partial [Longimicrobiales bacterium]|nr:glycosyltransferase 87 family protein [Longimicrobiales bacterium]
MSPDSSSAEPDRLLSRLILVGFTLRLILLFLTLGSNDVGTWYRFAQAVAEDGLERTYLEQVGFNHPPLMGLLSALLLHASTATGLLFPVTLKIPSVVAEGVTALLLYRIWYERSGREAGLRAAAAYALALSPILIAGYHGNTDAIYFSLALAAAYLMESRRAPFWAGLAVAGALNVKLIPLVVVLPLWSRSRNLREAGLYLAGMIFGAVPFLWTLLAFGADARRMLLERLLL